MKRYSPITEKFISAVWRRILIVRIAESLALSTAIASAAGLILMPILWLAGRSGFVIAVAMLTLGGIVGLIRGIARRPTKLQAAVEADRQLNLDDLLGTILLLTRRPTTDITPPQWAQAIVAVGESRCAALRPSAIVVAKLGLRAWGGVGIVAALLLAAGLLTTAPTSANAASSPGLIADQSRQDFPAKSAVASLDQSTPAQARPPGPGGTDENSNRPFSDARQDSSDQAAAPAFDNSDQSNRSASATGSGAAVTQAPAAQSPIGSLANSGLLSSPHRGAAASGIGSPDPNAISPGESDSATVGAAATLAHQPAPWNSDQWSTDIAAARDAINSGQIPNGDADLVRDYFQPN